MTDHRLKLLRRSLKEQGYSFGTDEDGDFWHRDGYSVNPKCPIDPHFYDWRSALIDAAADFCIRSVNEVDA